MDPRRQRLGQHPRGLEGWNGSQLACDRPWRRPAFFIVVAVGPLFTGGAAVVGFIVRRWLVVTVRSALLETAFDPGEVEDGAGGELRRRRRSPVAPAFLAGAFVVLARLPAPAAKRVVAPRRTARDGIDRHAARVP